MSNVYHADPAINAMLSNLDDEDRGLFLRATYFVLESHDDCSLEPLESAAEYALHIGLPDRPSRRYALDFDDLEDGIDTLEDLRRVFPDAALWLSCQEILAPIEDRNVWVGTVKARAGADPDDLDCEWNELAAAIDKARASGGEIDPDEYVDATIEAIAARI